MPVTLFHSPLACSLAVRIAAAEAGIDLKLEQVDLASKALASGGHLTAINPLGQVSTLRMENGDLLTETSACLLWVQAQSLEPAFRTEPSDPAYFQMVRWLSFIATELHKQIFRIVFYEEATDAVKDRFRALAPSRFDVLDAHLTDRPFLTGERFGAADAYLAWFFVLADRAGVALQEHPNLCAYRDRVLDRRHVAATIADDRVLAKNRE